MPNALEDYVPPHFKALHSVEQSCYFAKASRTDGVKREKTGEIGMAEENTERQVEDETDEQTTPSFSAGDRVRLSMRPPYFKTADTMPMLRPPDIVQVGEEGTVVNCRPGGYWSVRFSKGLFLMESQYIDQVSTEESE